MRKRGYSKHSAQTGFAQQNAIYQPLFFLSKAKQRNVFFQTKLNRKLVAHSRTSETPPLSRLRQLTHSPKIGRVSSQSGPHFGVKMQLPPIHSTLRYMDAKGVERLRQSLPALTDFDMQKICKDRKVRRAVMFAKGVSGGPHRPPTYTFESLVRC